MKLVKVSILCRSYDMLYQFSKTHGVSFWEQLKQRIKKDYPDFVVETKGTMQSIFYVPTTDDASVWKDRIAGYVTDISGSTADCVLFSADVSADDIQKLCEKNIDNISSREWFRDVLAAAQLEVPKHAQGSGNVSAAPAVSADAETAPASGKAEETPSVSRPVQVSHSKEETASADVTVPTTLSGEAERIGELRKALLSRVRGQRHAVDEVVQTIFECDAFASINESRRGPLATFLFCGPSGVGKTYLAKQIGKLLGRESLTVDMTEYSDNLANTKFNGTYNEPAVVTGFVRKYPKSVLIFDEIEKAHINTIHLFLQILDEGRLMDNKLNKEVSFRDTIIIITTNAGHSLYEDPTVTNLSGVPKQVILEGLRKDVDPSTKNPFFPECLTTRFANGNVILFNHLEPYALMEIVSDELSLQAELFCKSYGVEINMDVRKLAALVLYNSGGVTDARTLRGNARRILVRELQESVLQTYFRYGKSVDDLKRIEIRIDTADLTPEIEGLFTNRRDTHVAVFADGFVADSIAKVKADNIIIEAYSDLDECKRSMRGIVDCLLLDPAAGLANMSRLPNDIEDVVSEGMELFRYILKYYPETPIYLLDTRNRGEQAFATLLAKGGRGVVEYDIGGTPSINEALSNMALAANVNNAAYQLGRSSKALSYNCSQYNEDDSTAVISFEKLELTLAASAADRGSLATSDADNGVTFDDVVGCTAAKAVLRDFCKFIENPREQAAKGLRVPKGLLLYGPPGTGKTMLAQAMANESKAAFFPVAGASFFSPLVGSSEENVRALFRKARRYSPSVIFVDEVDAIARARTGSIGSTHNEDVLTTFLSEMAGFTKDERRPVFVIAATNYGISGTDGPVLDPAFVRRFDRRIFVDLPTEDDRFEFLKKALAKHAVNFGASHDEVLRNMARRSGGLSNADLDNIVEMFIRNTADSAPTPAALMDAMDNFRYGELNKVDPSSIRQTACHEAGHALVNRLLGNKVAFLTIASRGSYGGFMEYDHDETKANYTFTELKNRVCCALAGRVAEIIVYGEDSGLNTGAISDIKHARAYIKTALNDYAMGGKLYSRSRDAECEELMQEQFDRAKALITEHRAVLDKLTDMLVAEKSLDQVKLEEFFKAELSLG